MPRRGAQTSLHEHFGASSKRKSRKVSDEKPQKRKALPPSLGSESDDVEAIEFDVKKKKRKIVADSSESSESEDRPQSISKSPVASSSPDSSNVSDVKEQEVSTTRKEKVRNTLSGSDTDSELELLPSRPSTPPRKPRARLMRGRRTQSSPKADSEEEENLMDELDDDVIVEERLRPSKKSDFSSKLEELKRRRRGAPVTSSSESELASESEPDSEEEEDTGPRPERPDRPFKGSKPTHEYPLPEPDGIDDSFIVSDEEGNPDVSLPVQFSMDTHQDLAHHFKIICQLFVHLAMHSPRARKSFMREQNKNRYFFVPLSVVRRKLCGLKDSLVASSIWKPFFKKQLETQSQCHISQLTFTVPLCDACHITNRVATRAMILKGGQYDKNTFQSGQDSDGDDHGKTYSLGRFCAQRARVYHSFTHWEYKLFKSLESEVSDFRDPSSSTRGDFVRVNWGKSEDIPSGKDAQDPDKVMDWLDRRGVIKTEYGKLKKMMDDARDLEVKGSNGGDDFEG